MSENTAIVESPTQSIYGSQSEIDALARAVKRVAPWANDKKHPMSHEEIGLVVRRAMAMGLDALNPHEVQIWKDRHGVHFQIAYTFLAQWVREIKGGHTEPRFRVLDDEEKQVVGLFASDVAVEVSFMMKEDIPNLAALVEAGVEFDEARDMLTVRGVGCASASEYKGDYFAPNGRTRMWKVQKRALTDAYRRRFGTPPRGDIELLRRSRGEQDITPADWVETMEQLPAGANGDEHAKLAGMVADERTREPDDRDPEEILAEGRELLRGDQAQAGMEL